MQLVLGASVTMTLAACYGTPPPLPDCDDVKDPKSPCMVKPSPSPSPSASPSASSSPAQPG
ncbi:MAG: hypothetical protein ACAI44_00660 [Candidatus Sericytochromatia bacterium]